MSATRVGPRVCALEKFESFRVGDGERGSSEGCPCKVYGRNEDLTGKVKLHIQYVL